VFFLFFIYSLLLFFPFSFLFFSFFFVFFSEGTEAVTGDAGSVIRRDLFVLRIK